VPVAQPGYWLEPVTRLGRLGPAQSMQTRLDPALKKREWAGSGL